MPLTQEELLREAKITQEHDLPSPEMMYGHRTNVSWFIGELQVEITSKAGTPQAGVSNFLNLGFRMNIQKGEICHSGKGRWV